MEENNEILDKENIVAEESSEQTETAVAETAAVEEENTETVAVEEQSAETIAAEEESAETTVAEEGEASEENRVEEDSVENDAKVDSQEPATTEAETAPAAIIEEVPVTEEGTPAETPSQEEKPKKQRKRKAKNADGQAENGEDAEAALPKPDCPEAAIEAVLFATGHSVPIEQLADILNMKQAEVRESIANLKQKYDAEDRGITITELEDSVQLGTKGEYYEYLMKLAKHPKHYSLSDTVIETLSIVAYKQPVTRGEIEKIRGVSCDHALNKLIEYDLIEEVGRLDAPGKPLLFGTTEQFLRSFGVKSIGELPTVSPEMVEDFKNQAEAEAAEDMELEKVRVDV